VHPLKVSFYRVGAAELGINSMISCLINLFQIISICVHKMLS